MIIYKYKWRAYRVFNKRVNKSNKVYNMIISNRIIYNNIEVMISLI